VEKRNGCEIQPAQVCGRPKSAVLLYVSTVHHLERGLRIYCDLSPRMVGIQYGNKCGSAPDGLDSNFGDQCGIC